MSLMIVPLLILGPGLLIASLFVKRLLLRVPCLVGGVAILLWFVQLLASIPMAYEKEHRDVENRYHRQIIAEINAMLARGDGAGASNLTVRYLKDTENCSFFRNPLHDIVTGLNSTETEQTPAGDSLKLAPEE